MAAPAINKQLPYVRSPYNDYIHYSFIISSLQESFYPLLNYPFQYHTNKQVATSYESDFG